MPLTKITAAVVLATIQQMNSRQKFASQPVSLDTLTLALNISLAELNPFIDELRLSRDIVFHPPKVDGKRMSGSVSLT